MANSQTENLQAEEDEAQSGYFDAADQASPDDALHLLANHDAVTGLLNRQGFYDAVSEALDEYSVWGSEPTLMLVDILGFKAVNDAYGSNFGDEMLTAIGQRIAELAGPDGQVGRLGADDFTVLLAETESSASSIQIAKSVVDQLSETFDLDGRQVNVTASCGVALASAASGEIDGLFKAAELALGHAKRMGAGSVVVFEPRFLQEENDRAQLISDLRRDVGACRLEAYYQPLVDMQSRKLVSFETLLRWPHETRGNVSPDIFIPLAEETGIIIELGECVLREACAEAVNWPEHIRVAVNLSPIQFTHPSLLPMLRDVLDKTGLAPERLELEMTESTLLGGETSNLRTLEAIRAMGIRVAIDDFGTGYSSLGYLQTFKFDKIKIDKRFVRDLGSDYSSAAIIHTIIGLSNRMGIKTTGEGIETEQQFEEMQKLGCTEGQGYLFSPPLNIQKAREFIAQHATEQAA
jgi:diguanylate cyclase (GGDEF)-like protein